MNIAQACVGRHADGSGRLALVCDDGRGTVTRHSFDELHEQSGRLARGLAELGVARGDRVAVFLPQRVENPLAHLAAFRLGAISVPLSPLFRAEALEHRLGDAGAKVVVTDAEHASFLDGLPGRPTVVSCDADTPGTESVAALMRLGKVGIADTAADDPAMLLYTSGTTGLPRGALHAHRFVPGRLTALELMHRLESRPDPVRPFWTPADWSWVAGLVDSVLAPWSLGCPVFGLRRSGALDPDAVLDAVEAQRPRGLFLPPTAMHVLRRATRASRPSLRDISVHSAGEPLPAETFAWAASVFGEVSELYGTTEMGAVVGTSPFVPVRPGSMGKALPGHTVDLQDDDGRPVADGVVGEIVVRRPDPGMFLGYFGDAAATAARFRGDWLRTGDLARRDRDGYLWFQGRTDDVFNTSGYRVGPTEIEESLGRHPAVERAAVVGEPDAERGAVVKAFVVLRPGVAPSLALAAQIQAHVKQSLAAYEFPRKLVFARALPMTVTGKIRRAELRAPGADERFGIDPSRRR